VQLAEVVSGAVNGSGRLKTNSMRPVLSAARSKPSTPQARDRASTRQLIREAVIGSGRQLLPCCGLQQQLQLSIVVGRGDVTDIMRTAMGPVHDLHGRRALRPPHIRHRATTAPD
jgi:hypothetical protein